jgi:hypothetical protein
LIFENFRLEMEIQRLEMIAPELVGIARPALQGLLPFGLGVVDRPSAIAAKSVGKPVDLNLALSALGSPANQSHDRFHQLVGRPRGWLVKFLHQRLLLFFLLRHVAQLLGGFRRLALGHMRSAAEKQPTPLLGPPVCLVLRSSGDTILSSYSCAGMKRGILTSDRYSGIRTRDPVPRAQYRALNRQTSPALLLRSRAADPPHKRRSVAVPSFAVRPVGSGSNIFPDDSRFGEFDPRLGRCEFPVLCHGNSLASIDLPNRYNGQQWLRGGKIDKIPGSAGKAAGRRWSRASDRRCERLLSQGVDQWIGLVQQP